jgi:glycosyltransferase involved in cell wall biosynthesis
MDARRGPRALASDVLRVRALIRDESVDIVHTHHSHDHWLAVLTRPKRAQGGRTPVVRTFHNLRSVRRDRLGATLYRRTAAVFAVSRMIESRCREVGIPPEKISWIPGSVDLTRFTANADGGRSATSSSSVTRRSSPRSRGWRPTVVTSFSSPAFAS